MERAIAVTVEEVRAHLAEIEELAATAGAEIVEVIIQKRHQPDPSTYIGEGKLEEVHLKVHDLGVDLVIFDAELSPTQHRNLEEKLGVRVVDRTQLILDIFAARAQSKEGKLQVELAQLSYLLPRLSGKGQSLSRLGGGIGTRGPGETKLEVDKRRIRQRINSLKRELAEVKVHRNQQRSLRKRKGIPLIALVGYTNAGKSTLFNRLTEAGVVSEDKLFATLDPTVRRIELPSGLVVLLSDTVGFIRKLPHELINAFHSTLEEVIEADLLLQVTDASDSELFEQIKAVREVLTDLGVGAKPMVTVLNKIDLVDPTLLKGLQSYLPGAMGISALTGRGLPQLLAKLEEKILGQRVELKLLVPYKSGSLVDQLHQEVLVLEEEYGPEGTYLTVVVEEKAVNRLKKFQISEGKEK